MAQRIFQRRDQPHSPEANIYCKIITLFMFIAVVWYTVTIKDRLYASHSHLSLYRAEHPVQLTSPNHSTSHASTESSSPKDAPKAAANGANAATSGSKPAASQTASSSASRSKPSDDDADSSMGDTESSGFDASALSLEGFPGLEKPVENEVGAVADADDDDSDESRSGPSRSRSGSRSTSSSQGAGSDDDDDDDDDSSSSALAQRGAANYIRGQPRDDDRS